MSINCKSFNNEGRMRIIRFTVVRLPFLIERLSHTMTKDNIRRYKQRCFHVTKFTYFIRRRISRYTLRLYTFTFMCKRTNANGLSARIGICRIVFLNRFPIKRNIFKRLNFRAACFLCCVIINACTFERTIMKGIKSNVGRDLRVINDLIRVNLRILISFFRLNRTTFNNFYFFFLTLLRRLSSKFKR